MEDEKNMSNQTAEPVEDKATVDLVKRAKSGTTVLFVLTGLALLGGIILMGMGEEEYETLGLGALILGGVYLVLALWSRKQAFPALLTATVLYAVMVIFSVVSGAVNVLQIAIQAMILVLLARSAMAANNLRKKS